MYEPGSVDSLRAAHTALVSDICDDLELDNPMLDHNIQRVTGVPGRVVVGSAYPCRVEPTDEYVEIHTLLEMIGTLPAGSVPVVVSDDGFPAALWGGLMSAGARHRGVEAAVTNGLVRDVDQIGGVDFDVFGIGRTALDIRRRGAMRAYNIPVLIGKRTVSPGDVVIADGNGVAILAAAVVDQVAAACDTRLGPEDATFEGLAAGVPPAELFDRYGQF